MKHDRRRVVLKSQREIEIMREANVHVAEILDAMFEAVVPGATTWDLEMIARQELKRRGVTAAFLGYKGYPAAVCASVNEEIVHGIPSKKRVLKEGDILSLDFGVVHRGYVGDAARTVGVGKISVDAQRVIDVTRECLQRAIAVCTPNHRLSDLAKAVEGWATQNGFSVIRDFVGHGVGTQMHEEPQIPNYFDGHKPRLKPGMVLAIEPMLAAGSYEVQVLQDGWTAITRDRSLSAHFEHSVAILDGEPFVLSRP